MVCHIIELAFTLHVCNLMPLAGMIASGGSLLELDSFPLATRAPAAPAPQCIHSHFPTVHRPPPPPPPPLMARPLSAFRAASCVIFEPTACFCLPVCPTHRCMETLKAKSLTGVIQTRNEALGQQQTTLKILI
jgi:hypothetical protein